MRKIDGYERQADRSATRSATDSAVLRLERPRRRVEGDDGTVAEDDQKGKEDLEIVTRK
jgi:hypothetical protein